MRPLTDLDEAKALVRKVCTAHPDYVNPTDADGTCMYNEYNQDGTVDPDGRHCIAATIFIEELGINPDDLIEETSAHNVLRHLFPDTYDGAEHHIGPDPEPALRLLTEVQNIADGNGVRIVVDGTLVDDGSPSGGLLLPPSINGPRPWGEVLTLAEKAGLL